MKCKCGSERFEIVTIENENDNTSQDTIQCSKCGEILLTECPICGEFHVSPLKYCLTTGENIKMVQELKKVKREIQSQKLDKIVGPLLRIALILIIGGFVLVLCIRGIIWGLPLALGICLVIIALILDDLIHQKSLGEKWARRKFPELFRRKEELEKEIERTKKK
ncbi:MAG: hypothetical protein PHG83_00270 [Patescibacteria group bacterium]|nr:hypothetical protein [Patescibacteria group bacterium]